MIRRILILMAIIAGVSIPAHAQLSSIGGFCESGASKAIVSNIQSSNYLQGTVPYCKVQVYLTGTTTSAAIFKDKNSTALGNPFTATASGQYTFFASSSSCYDVVLSGGVVPNTYPVPVTVTDVCGNGQGGSLIAPLVITGKNLFTPAAAAGTTAASAIFGNTSYSYCNPGQVNGIWSVYPNCGFSNVEFASIGGGHDEYISGIPSYKTNWDIFAATAYLDTDGQSLIGGYAVNCNSQSQDCYSSPGSYGFISGSALNNADEGAHPGGDQITQVNQAQLISCASGCGTGVSSFVFTPVPTDSNGNFTGLMGDGRIIEDWASPILSTTIGSHIINGVTQGYPLSNVTLSANWATNSWMGLSTTPVIATYSSATLTRSGGIVTATGTFSGPLLQAGTSVVPVGPADASFAGTFVLTSSTSTTMTWAQAGANATTTSAISTPPIGAMGTTSVTIQSLPTWSSSTTYANAQAVTYGGLQYISAINGNTGNTPSSSNSWVLAPEFATSTSALGSSGIACVSDANTNAGYDYYETVPWVKMGANILQLTFAKPHPDIIVISIGGLCQNQFYPNAHKYGNPAAGYIGQSNVIVGNYGATIYFGDGAQTRAILVNQPNSESEIYYNSTTSYSVTRSSNVTTLVANLSWDMNQHTLVITGCADSSYNSAAALATQAAANTFTYANSGANGTTTGCTVIDDNAEYTIVPGVKIAQLMNPATNKIDGTIGALEPNSITINSSDQLVVQTAPQMSVSSKLDFNSVTQYTPHPNYYGLNVPGNDGVIGGRAGPSMFQYVSINRTPFNYYSLLGGYKSPPLTARGSNGVYQWDNTETYVGLSGWSTIGCKPAPINCNSWNSTYTLFDLRGQTANTEITHNPLTNTLSISSLASAGSTLQLQNLVVTGTATIPLAPLTNGINVPLITPNPFGDSSGYNVGFSISGGTPLSYIGLATRYGGSQKLVVGQCFGFTQNGNSDICSPGSGNVLQAGGYMSSYSSSFNGVQSGLPLPVAPLSCTYTGAAGSIDLIYDLLGKNSSGVLTPIGATFFNIPNTAALGGGNSVTCTFPSSLQNGYPSGSSYEWVKTTNAGTYYDLGPVTLGGTGVDNGSITTTQTLPQVNATAPVYASSVGFSSNPQLTVTTSTNNDIEGSLTFSAATTATYTWINTYTAHPTVTGLVPSATTATSGAPWVTYTGQTSFTVNFPSAFTGTVGYGAVGGH